MTPQSIALFGIPIVPLPKGLEEDCVTFALGVVVGSKYTLVSYTRSEYSAALSQEMFEQHQMDGFADQVAHRAFMFSPKAMTQLKKELGVES